MSPTTQSRGNALHYGLRATDELFLSTLQDPERLVFEEFRADIHAEYKPKSAQEKLLVDHITVQHFRLFRLYRLEYLSTCQSELNPLAADSVVPHLDRFSRYDSRLQRELRVLHNRLRYLYFKRGDFSLIELPIRE
jgi:hypothetical protein